MSPSHTHAFCAVHGAETHDPATDERQLALLPFRVAVTVAVPRVWPVALKLALVCPAGTVTVAGSVTMPAGEAARLMTVGLLCAAEMVTVKVCCAPGLRLAVAGCMATTVGGAGVTVI